MQDNTPEFFFFCCNRICLLHWTFSFIMFVITGTDVLLLKDEPNPKCFSRTMCDFICFFETEDNRTYDFFYTADQPPKRCEISVQRTEEGTFLHICSIPEGDILLYFEIYLEVTEPITNTTLYNRTLFVHKHVLLDPPTNVSLHSNGQVGQLNVSWHANILKYIQVKVKYGIEYSSGVRDTEREKEQVHDTVLDALTPGEEVKVQVKIKPTSVNDGPWSSWSHPVRAVVPQSTDDIALICFTSDLQNVTCHWNLSKYDEENNFKLLYQIGHRGTTWNECAADENITDLCCFHGERSKKVWVKLTKSSGPIRRIFYAKPFTLSNSVKTSPPTHLKRIQNNNKLCLEWEAPLPSLSTHLQYELDHQLKENKGWKMVKGPKTDTCVEVPAGSQYRVRVRAKPAGHIYFGYWSDWSDMLQGETPISDMLAEICISIFTLSVVIIIVTALCFMYISKLKQYFWPPIPNPEKVLQGFLIEINRNKRDPPVLAKQCSEETTTSLVEIMSEEEVSGLRKTSEEFSELLSSEGSFTSSELVDGSPVTEVFPDYVTLNKNSIFLCPQGNTYIYEQVIEKGDPEIEDEYLPTCQCSCSDGSVCVSPCLCSDLLNHSYLPLAEPADKFSSRYFVRLQVCDSIQGCDN
uniref:MPL proto-oncogene, thrombopoietin receptor n=1 Tax=Amphilophus citrinellus TaxID=61819 RepID=A0A3Q0RQI9_AMPCI